MSDFVRRCGLNFKNHNELLTLWWFDVLIILWKILANENALSLARSESS
jgi:hypothetical protein